MKSIANFLFEIGMLKKTPRSGYFFLGAGNESVAEHIMRMTYIGYVMAKLEPELDECKLMKMCLFHDLAEARTGDLNYVNKKYVASNEEKVLSELSERLPFGEEIAALVREFNDKRTPEALLANDADQLDLLFHVKEEADRGNPQTGPWIEYAYQRLLTEPARQLGRLAMETDSADWWLADRDDPTRT